VTFDGGCHDLREVDSFEGPENAEVNDEVSHIDREVVEVFT
jgi:hypothetical protein